MSDETLYLMTLHKNGKRIGLEVNDNIEPLTERAPNYKDLADEVKFWECKEISVKNKVKPDSE
jgi:hypothetical protein